LTPKMSYYNKKSLLHFATALVKYTNNPIWRNFIFDFDCCC